MVVDVFYGHPLYNGNCKTTIALTAAIGSYRQEIIYIV